MSRKLQVEILHKKFDLLQRKYGAKELDSIYGAGCIENPNIMFIFMNPTGKNIVTTKNWKGIKAQWLGTKNIWKLFKELNIISSSTYQVIKRLKSYEWSYDFCYKLYEEIANNKIYITNLGKCTQIDARPLPNKVFREYLNLLEKEIDLIKPKIIITFGNQVSSIVLNQNISVSKCRNNFYIKNINNINYKVYPVYYPIGQGMRNIDLAINDIKNIIKENMIGKL